MVNIVMSGVDKIMDDDYIVEEKDVYLLPYLNGYSYERVAAKDKLYDYKLKVKPSGILTETISKKSEKPGEVKSRVEHGVLVRPKSVQVMAIEEQEKLSLIPIQGTCRLIPSFEKDSKVNNENKGETEEDLKVLQVQFKKRESNEEIKQRMQSYVYQYNSLVNEPWDERNIVYNPMILSKTLNYMDMNNGC